MTEYRIGISGWTYKPWRGVFYPKGLVQSRELEYASRELNSIEINGTFYSLQRPASYRKWASETPDDFKFSLKGPKFFTHMKKLTNIRQPLANFFASGPLLLGKKLGPILWQFPPSYRFNPEKLEAFLQLLPRSSTEASIYASEHDMKNPDWVWTKAIAKTPIRYAFEVRHPSFATPEFIELLRKYKAAFVIADTAGKWPYAEDLTTDFMYLRLHGDKELYASGYSDEKLKWWADRLTLWSKGEQPKDAILIDPKPRKAKSMKSVHVYFDNDIKVHAPFDAKKLGEMVTGKSRG